MPSEKNFTFAISLSVLDHLGRNLYRSFATVVGEAISNAWDADAKNVYIFVSPKKDSFFIKDDGHGMSADDFQEKFLKIGYSKRKSGDKESPNGRPYIGRKGIGKLALLSCAKKVTIISKKQGQGYVGGIIDNSGLNKAITDDLKPDEYPLENWDPKTFSAYTRGHKNGTIIYFEDVKDGIKSSLDHLKKIIALYFRFSLLDKSFNIFVNGERVTHKHLNDLAQNTEFLWSINKMDDPYIDAVAKHLKHPKITIKAKKELHGFVASVIKPRDLKINATDERVGIDLFVNGRLRETGILKHIPTARIAESYLYGQIHFNSLDDGKDRFTSSREGIVADDPKYQKFLEDFRKIILEIVNSWDDLRRKYRKEGDSENPVMTPAARRAEALFNAVSDEYDLPKKSKHRKKVDGWVDALKGDATFNLESYAECFVSENLIRKYIEDKKIPLSKEAKDKAKEWKKVEVDSKNKGNISIDVRRDSDDARYLSMNDLAYLVDKKDPLKYACLARDANEYKPMRDAVAHTALLTLPAKTKLTAVYENIKARIVKLLSS